MNAVKVTCAECGATLTGHRRFRYGWSVEWHLIFHTSERCPGSYRYDHEIAEADVEDVDRFRTGTGAE